MERHIFHLMIPRARVNDASRALRVTSNDIVLSASAEAVRSLVLDSAAQRSRVAIPVSLRSRAAPAAIGNSTGILIITAKGGRPSSSTDIHDLSRDVHRKLKKGDPQGYQALCELTASLGRWTQTALNRISGRLGAYDILVTSLVGASRPLTLAGARMEWLCPIAQLFSDQVVSLAFAAYDGQYHLGILATDAEAGEIFANALDTALAEMTATKPPVPV